MKIESVETTLGGKKVTIETGKWAKQAHGSVTVTCGGTVVLVTACMSKSPREGIDFFPLMVEYQEKTYAAGKIPGGFFKREGRPTEKEILTSRIIDRPIRPLFPEGFYNEVQVVCTVLSHDGENDADVLGVVGASAALTISNIPFDGPIGSVRVGSIDGQLVANPTYEERENCELDFIIVGREDGVVMIEGEGNQIPEDKIMEAVQFGLDSLQDSIKIQHELQKKAGVEKADVEYRLYPEEFIAKVRELSEAKLGEAYKIAKKEDRDAAVDAIFSEITEDMTAYEQFKKGDDDITARDVWNVFDEVQYGEVRKLGFEKGLRADGRKLAELRDLASEVNVLPRTHGSALFTRGQTQSLAVVTFGAKDAEQMVESLEGKSYNPFMLHYNFPSFSVGEARPMRGPGRREIGHGVLARKSLVPVIPTKEEFPYTIRLVSEILESNGSSSMASVCGGSLALMAAGVPIKAPVAGISIGLISGDSDDQALLLTDIMGMEDHFGDMDFKVAGSEQGVTGIQLDLKVKKISVALLTKAIQQAREARLTILENMKATISQPAEMSPFAPRIETVQVPQESIGEVIGPGGKTIRKIMEITGATSIDIDEDGKVFISAPDGESLEKAVTYINKMMEKPEVGKIYDAVAKRVTDFGVFCEILPGKEGLVHVSELANEYVKNVSDHVKEGDEFKVKLLEIDKMKRLNLSRKAAEAPAEAEATE